jgi:hypothetical protein
MQLQVAYMYATLDPASLRPHEVLGNQTNGKYFTASCMYSRVRKVRDTSIILTSTSQPFPRGPRPKVLIKWVRPFRALELVLLRFLFKLWNIFCHMKRFEGEVELLAMRDT